jgi:hypothetical protein
MWPLKSLFALKLQRGRPPQVADIRLAISIVLNTDPREQLNNPTGGSDWPPRRRRDKEKAGVVRTG